MSIIPLRVLRSLGYDTKVVSTGDIDFRVSGMDLRFLVEANDPTFAMLILFGVLPEEDWDESTTGMVLRAMNSANAQIKVGRLVLGGGGVRAEAHAFYYSEAELTRLIPDLILAIRVAGVVFGREYKEQQKRWLSTADDETDVEAADD